MKASVILLGTEDYYHHHTMLFQRDKVYTANVYDAAYCILDETGNWTMINKLLFKEIKGDNMAEKKSMYEYERGEYSVRIFVDHLDQPSCHRFLYPKDSTAATRAAFLEDALESVLQAMETEYNTGT